MNFTFNKQTLLNRAAVWNMPAFLQTYTLHDSALYEIRARSSAKLLVFIKWDLHWNKMISPACDLLVIRFCTNYWMQWKAGAWEQPTLDGATSKIVLQIEREQMLNDKRFDLRAYQNERINTQAPMMDESLTRTIFNFINWGECEILHSSEVSIACFDKSGNAGEIPFENAA